MILSASQVDSFGDCPRKWAWRSIAKIPAPSGPSAALGSEVHGQIERYLKFGQPLDLNTEPGRIAMAGMHHWPSRALPLRVEEPFTLDLGGFQFRGFKDIAHDPPLGVPLIDHKTTSNFAYAQTPESLLENVQGALYAHHEMLRWGADSVPMRWIYYRTRGAPKSHLVEAVATPYNIGGALGTIRTRAAHMVPLALAQVNPLDLPAHPGTCEKYGGCPFRSNCNLTDAEKIEAIMSNSADMLARLAARVNPGAPAPQAPAPAAVPAPAPAMPNLPAGWSWGTDPATGQPTAFPPGYAPAPQAPAPTPVEQAAPEVPAPAPAPEAAPLAPLKRGPGRPPKVQRTTEAHLAPAPPVPAPALAPDGAPVVTMPATDADLEAFDRGVETLAEGLTMTAQALIRLLVVR